MFEGLLAPYVMQRLIDQAHPVLELNHCVGKKQRKISCTKCKDICPKGVYDTGKPNWDKCTNCNLCVSACPSRCLLPSSLNLEKYVSSLHSGASFISFACERNAPKADISLPCLAALPWELICCFALKKNISIPTGSCEECDRKDCAVLLNSNLTKAALFLGDEYFNKHVTFLAAGTSPAEKVYTRRELFGILTGRSKSAAGAAATFLSKNKIEMDGVFFRKLLHSLIKERRETPMEGDPIPAKFQWSVPSFSQNCWACGICAKVCPQGAIKISEPEENVCKISIALWKCNACGLCKDICSSGGVGEPQTVSIDNLMNFEAHQVQITPCEGCENPIKPGTSLCPACMSKMKRRR